MIEVFNPFAQLGVTEMPCCVEDQNMNFNPNRTGNVKLLFYFSLIYLTFLKNITFSDSPWGCTVIQLGGGAFFSTLKRGSQDLYLLVCMGDTLLRFNLLTKNQITFFRKYLQNRRGRGGP